MNLLNEKMPCTIYFKNKNNEFTSSQGQINPFIGSIEHKFSGNNISHVVFEHNSKPYRFELQTLGGRYFVKNFESSPFYQLFYLQKELPQKNTPQPKKLKI